MCDPAGSFSVITLEEVLVGLSYRPRERLARWFERFLIDHCEVLPVTPSIAIVNPFDLRT